MKQLIAVLLICIATVAFADLRDDLSQQSQMLIKEEARLWQLREAKEDQELIIKQRRAIIDYIQYQIKQAKEAEKVYQNEQKKDENAGVHGS